MVKVGKSANEAKVFPALENRQGPCLKKINALKLLANLQQGSDRLVQDTVLMASAPTVAGQSPKR